MKVDIFMNNIARYTTSIFQDFESGLSTEVDLVGDDIRLVLDEYISIVFTYEFEPGIYTFNDISETF